MPNRELNLATSIASCHSVQDALIDPKHPCRKVVNAQTKLIDSELKRQRPEPWMGGLASAKLLFVSSNPSINEDPFPLGEVFPTYAWSEDESGEFFVDRCNPEADNVKVTFNIASEPDFLTLCHDGEYRSGVSNSKRSQPTWKNTHDRAVEILGKEAHPHFDYAITEIVHCKSKAAAGVKESSNHCIEKWMNSIFEISPANVVVLLGSKVRDLYAKPFLEVPTGFGDNKEYGKLSCAQRVNRDVFIREVGGKSRIFLFNWHPTASVLRTLHKVYGQTAVEYLSRVAHGAEPVPSPEKLASKLIGF